MSITTIISAQVSNLDQWKSKFDNFEEQRLIARISARAYRKPEDLNASYVIGTAPPKEAFVEFFTSPERLAIQDSGVITSPPEITFLEEC